MPNSPTLTKSQLETLRRKLEGERNRVIRVIQASVTTAPSEDEGSEIEEIAQRATERTQERGIAERERALLSEIERALAKFSAGTYGLSEKTGAPIPYDRLEAVPWAHQRAEEESP